MEEVKTITEEQPIKRKRGRPPKNPEDRKPRFMPDSKTGMICAGCGKDMSVQERRTVNKSFHHSGYSPYCRNCQQKRYSYFYRLVFGRRRLAIFLCCAAFDIPFILDAAETCKAETTGVWRAYMREIYKSKRSVDSEGTQLGFDGGCTDLTEALGKEMPDLRYDSPDGELTDSERWKKHWGEEYQPKDCRELDRIYDMYSSEYKGGISPRLEISLRSLSKSCLKRDKAMDSGDSTDAKRWQEVMDKIMTSEAMKAGDAKPIEVLRPDSLVDNLEKRGVRMWNLESVQEYIKNDKGNYHTSVDVVDTMMLMIENTRRMNNGQSELSELPKNLQVFDEFGELKTEPTEIERDTMNQLGIAPPTRNNE